MRNLTLLTVIFLATALSLPYLGNAQTLQWAKSIGGTGFEQGQAVTVNSEGNVYSTGIFQDTIDFDPGPGTANLISTGGGDIFISKLDANGDYEWAKSMDGSLGGVGFDIAVDADGNVFSTGVFAGTVDFNPGLGTANLTSAGKSDIFISKLDANGNYLWAIAMGDTIGDQGKSIAIDPGGNVYISGYFAGTVDFDPGPATAILTSLGNYDAFICKYSASGNYVWAKAIGGTEDVAAYSIALDDAGNVYTMGNFGGTADFNPGPGTTFFTGEGIFVTKLDANGNFVWARALEESDGYTLGLSFAVDASGNIYSTGSFEETVDFDPGAGTAIRTATGYGSGFLSKLDANGNFEWVQVLDGTYFGPFGYSLALDEAGNIYSTGFFKETVDFDPGHGTANLTDSGVYDIFIYKLDANGNFEWAKALGGYSDDRGFSIAVDKEGFVYCTGYFEDTVDFDPAPGTTNLISAGGNDIFILKMSAIPTSISNEPALSPFELYPNPTQGSITVNLPETWRGLSLSVTTPLGQVVKTHVITSTSLEMDLYQVSSGIYFIQVQTPKGKFSQKIIKE